MGIVPYSALSFAAFETLKASEVDLPLEDTSYPLLSHVLYAGANWISLSYWSQAILQRRAESAATCTGKDPQEAHIPVVQRLGSGAVSGFFAQSATYPLHVVRRRMQARLL